MKKETLPLTPKDLIDDAVRIISFYEDVLEERAQEIERLKRRIFELERQLLGALDTSKRH